MNSEDVILIQRWNESRDPSAFHEIVHRYAGLVYGAALRILKNPDDAEDVSQECFLTLTEQPIGANESLGGWLYTLATRRSLNRIRGESRRQSREEGFASERPTAIAPGWDDVQDRIDEAIAELSDDLRRPLIEHYMVGRTMDSIGSELGISRQAVHVRVHKAIEQVRSTLKKNGLPVAPVVLTGGLAQLSESEASQSLLRKLANTAISGLDRTALTGASGQQIWSSMLLPALGIVGIIAMIAATWIMGSGSGDGPLARVPNVDVAESAPAQGSEDVRLAQNVAGSDGAKDDRGDSASALADGRMPDFREFSLEREFPGPGVGTVYAYVASPNAVGAELTLSYLNWEPWEAIPTTRLVYTERVTENRIALFENLPLGDYQVRIRAEGGGANWNVTLSESMTGYHMIVPLLPTSSVRVMVRNEDGELIPGARAQVYEHQLLGGRTPFALSRMSENEIGADGSVVMSSVLAGGVKAFVTAPGYAPAATDWIRSRKEPMEVILGRGARLRCRVVTAEGEPVDGVVVHARGQYFGDHGIAHADADGVALVSHLRSGDYRLGVYSDRFVLSGDAPRVFIPGDAEVDFGELQVVPGMEIAGRVADADSDVGIAGVRLSIEADTGVAIEDVVTDAAGEYLIKNASFTEYTIRRHSTSEYGYASGPRQLAVKVTPDGVEGSTEFMLSRGIRISGRVVNTEGRPVAGGFVRVGTTRESLRRDSTTDRQGRFQLSTLTEPGDVYISVQAAGYGQFTHGPVEIPELGRGDIEIEIPHAAVLTGSIKIDGRFAPSQTYLYATPSDPESEEGRVAPQETYTFTAPLRGLYIQSWLTPGSYDLSVRPPGGSRSSTVATVTVAEGEQLENFTVDYRTSGHSLSGKVLNRRGVPVTGATLSLFEDVPHDYVLLRTTTDTEGLFRFSGLRDGGYVVVGTHGDYSTAQSDVFSAPAQNVRLTLPDRGAVAGTVRDAQTGNPLQRFQVATLAEGLSPSLAQTLDWRTVVNEYGEFEVDGVQAGLTTVNVRSEGYAPAFSETVEVQENRSTQRIELRLSSACIVSGVVVDEDGAPISGATVRSMSGSRDILNRDELARSDDEGQFRIDSLQAGAHQLHVTHSDYARGVLDVTTGYGMTTDADVTLYGGAALSGSVFSDGMPIQNAHIFLYRSGQNTQIQWARTDESGLYLIEQIPAGDYQVQLAIRDDQGVTTHTEEHRFAIGHNQTLVLDWDI